MWVESGYGQSAAETVSCGGGAQSETHYKWSNLKHFLNPYQWDQAGMGRWGIREKQGKNGLWSGGKAISCLWGKKKLQHIALSLCSASFREKTFKCIPCWLFPPVPPHAVGAGAPCEAQVEKQQPLLFDKEKKTSLRSGTSVICRITYRKRKTDSTLTLAPCRSRAVFPSWFEFTTLSAASGWRCVLDPLIKVYHRICRFIRIILITAQCTRLFNFCTYKTTDSLSAICIYIYLL